MMRVCHLVEQDVVPRPTSSIVKKPSLLSQPFFHDDNHNDNKNNNTNKNAI